MPFHLHLRAAHIEHRQSNLLLQILLALPSTDGGRNPAETRPRQPFAAHRPIYQRIIHERLQQSQQRFSPLAHRLQDALARRSKNTLQQKSLLFTYPGKVSAISKQNPKSLNSYLVIFNKLHPLIRVLITLRFISAIYDLQLTQ